MIQVRHLAKHYGSTVAVDDLSFDARPGRVTGFLGPNGAGKSTTMRMILGLDAPSAGQATVNGVTYAQLRHRSARSAPSSTPGPFTAAAVPTTTCSAWPPATGSPAHAWTRSWRLSG